jgi:hypothetical protein
MPPAPRLQRLGLVLDWMVLQHQLRDSLDYFDAFRSFRRAQPHRWTMRSGRFSRPESYQQWTDDMAEVAKRPNVVLKLGGFGMWHVSWPTSNDMAISAVLTEAWQPWPIRASSVGPDRHVRATSRSARSGGYRQTWNATDALRRLLARRAQRCSTTRGARLLARRVAANAWVHVSAVEVRQRRKGSGSCSRRFRRRPQRVRCSTVTSTERLRLLGRWRRVQARAEGPPDADDPSLVMHTTLYASATVQAPRTARPHAAQDPLSARAGRVERGERS